MVFILKSAVRTNISVTKRLFSVGKRLKNAEALLSNTPPPLSWKNA